MTNEHITKNHSKLTNFGTVLNKKTKNYETFYRDYDPALGRFNQIDPLASSFGSITPYNYAFNDPVALNDPNGDCPSCYITSDGEVLNFYAALYMDGSGGAEGGAGGGGYGNLWVQ